jgi:hypothetical protein
MAVGFLGGISQRALAGAALLPFPLIMHDGSSDIDGQVTYSVQYF